MALLPIVLFYYFGLTLGENIGDHGRIPPWLAMWAPNMIVGAVALYLLRASLKERPIPLVALLQRGSGRRWRPPGRSGQPRRGLKRARIAVTGRRAAPAAAGDREGPSARRAGRVSESRAPLVYGFIGYARSSSSWASCCRTASR